MGRDGVRVPLALAALVRDGRVLLVHRRAGRLHYPDCWDLVGGHIDRGEQPVDAVRRECLEELAVVVHEAEPFRLTVADPVLDVHAFVVVRWDGEPVNAAPDEHDDLRWFAPEDLESLDLAHPSSRDDIVEAIRRAARG